MPLPPDFAQESLYTPDAWFVTDATFDGLAHSVHGVVDTTLLGPFVASQRQWPGHPRHFPAAVAVQLTGTLGSLHAIYLLGLRPTQGWVGFGTHIRKARFGKMGKIGPVMDAHAVCTRRRRFGKTWFLTYDFRFEQEGAVVYSSQQTAAWFQTEHRGPLSG